MKIAVWTDGGCRTNPGAGSCGWVMKDDVGRLIASRGKFLPYTTNNQAEYDAFIDSATNILGLIHDTIIKPIKIDFYSDSMLMVQQLNGKWRCKNLVLQRWYENALLLRIKMEVFVKVSIQYIPRKDNVEADLICNQVMDEYKVGNRFKH